MGQLIKDFVTLQTPVDGGGSGNGTVTVSANSDNTGRGARNVDVTFSASGITYTRSISQAGKPEFVTIESVKAVDKAGATTVSISGTSNSKKLTFAISSGATLELVLPASYIANSVTTNNGVDISLFSSNINNTSLYSLGQFPCTNSYSDLIALLTLPSLSHNNSENIELDTEDST